MQKMRLCVLYKTKMAPTVGNDVLGYAGIQRARDATDTDTTTGETIPLHAGAHQTRTPRPLHT